MAIEKQATVTVRSTLQLFSQGEISLGELARFCEELMAEAVSDSTIVNVSEWNISCVAEV